MGVKELVYRAATTRPSRAVLRRLGALVDVPDLRGARGSPTPLVVTVDVEGGYVREDERRVWQGREPDALQGYVDGIPNLLAVLDRHGVKATFLVSPHGLSARGATLDAVRRALGRVRDEGHEIGLHLHPTSDRAIAARLGRTFDEGRAPRLPPADRRALVATGKAILEDALGCALVSFRWGNWAADAGSLACVAEAGFRVDSSAVPRLRDGRRRRYDWSACTARAPFAIAPGLVEVPIATFRFAGRWLRADPLYGPLVDAALDAFREEGAAPFVIMTHSTEATTRDGSPTRLLDDLDRFLARAVRLADVAAVRLRDV